jgi:hypothetical protein
VNDLNGIGLVAEARKKSQRHIHELAEREVARGLRLTLDKWPVYVDPLNIYPTKIRCFQKGSCHMFMDAPPGGETRAVWLSTLHTVAHAIGMKLIWFQDKPHFPHYDLVPSRRRAALALGVKELNFGEAMVRMHAWREFSTIT